MRCVYMYLLSSNHSKYKRDATSNWHLEDHLQFAKLPNYYCMALNYMFNLLFQLHITLVVLVTKLGFHYGMYMMYW